MAQWVTGKKKEKIETFPVGEDLMGFESLTSSQQAASDALVQALLQQIGGEHAPFKPSPFAYEGVSPADVGTLPGVLATMPGISPEVQQTLSTLMAGAGAQPTDLSSILASIPTFGGELGGETASALKRALNGKFPEEYFQASIAGPAREAFREEAAPAIREEFAGPGTFWGTARAGAVTGERGKMERNLAAIRGELGNKAQDRALQAVGISINARQNQIQLAMSELNSQRTYATGQQRTALDAAIAQLQSEQSTMIAAQNELNRLTQGKYQEIAMAQERWLTGVRTAFEDYTRRNPAMAEILQSILSYLNIPMLATYQEYDEGGGAGGWSSAISSARGVS